MATLKNLLQFPLKKKEKAVLVDDKVLGIPNVVGMNVADAVNVLKKAGLAYEFCGFKEIIPRNVMEGTVKIQSPLGGSPLKRNLIIKLYISMDLIK